MVFSYLLFLLCFLVSVIYVCRKLSGPGMNKQVRELVMKRHIFTLTAYIITWAYFFAFTTMFAFSDESERKKLFLGSDFWVYKVL